MIAVIFESTPAGAQKEEYLRVASELRSLLETIDGFISIERFASLSDPDKVLSLSFWRDEKAVRRWRTKLEHREAQAIGRDRLFDDYRIRVAAVIRDYGKTERSQAPADSIEAHSPGL